MILAIAASATILCDILIIAPLTIGWIRIREGGAAQAYATLLAGALPLLLGGILYAVAVFVGVAAAARTTGGQHDAITAVYTGLYFVLALWSYSLTVPAAIRFLRTIALEEAQHRKEG
jgi:hypothetical protein